MAVKLPKKYFKYLSDEEEISVILPIAPDNLIDFIDEFRPNIGRMAQTFDLAPFWIEPLLDNHPNILMVNGRQTFKTTNCANLIAWVATRYPGCEVSYVVDDEQHKSAFSEQRLRNETFIANPKLAQFLPHQRANIGRIRLLNGSVTYLLTDEGHYHQVEGKSNKILVFDETQAQDVGFLPVAMYSLGKTKGRLVMFGIGGEAGSDYYKLWQRTDQREWIYDDRYWRAKLKFDAFGNIVNDVDDLKQILAGKWVSQRPENVNYRGYHFPQTIFPHVPITIDDAISKYQTQPELSIQYQQRHYSSSMFLSHTLGEFYKAERRPITPEMVERCYIRYLPLLKAAEVRKLKEVFGNDIKIFGGVDFGSGPSASKTVASIVIRWRKSDRYQLVHIDPRPQEHQLDQARYIAELFRDFGVDFAVGDLGYGQIQVKVIQDGGRDSRDIKFEGLGRKRFTGCRTTGDETKPEMQYMQEADEHGTQLGRIQIDKTTVIQGFVDFVGKYVSHPTRPTEEELKKPVFMIPMKNDWETDFLMDDFCSITRKDLEEDTEVRVEDPRQRAKKEFNHPPDSVMSIIYCLVADQNWNPDAFKISPVRKGRR